MTEKPYTSNVRVTSSAYDGGSTLVLLKGPIYHEELLELYSWYLVSLKRNEIPAKKLTLKELRTIVLKAKIIKASRHG